MPIALSFKMRYSGAVGWLRSSRGASIRMCTCTSCCCCCCCCCCLLRVLLLRVASVVYAKEGKGNGRKGNGRKGKSVRCSSGSAVEVGMHRKGQETRKART